MDVELDLGRGFAALESGDWEDARRHFASVVAAAEIAEAYFGLANALWWLGDRAGTMESCEKAYAAFCARPDPMMAAAAALTLVGYNKAYLGNTTAARGWLARGARIIDDNNLDEMRGDLLGATSYVTDDPIESERLAREALAIGRRTGNIDLELLALNAVGAGLVQQGRIEEGMSLLDECMAAAIGGETSQPLTVAQLSCMTMVVCGSSFDLERAAGWVQALDRFVDRYGCPFVYAECRAYYGRVLFENGDWEEAARFLTEAVAISKGVFPAPHAFAAGTLAELKLAQGKMEEAERVLESCEGRDECVVAVASLHLLRGTSSVALALLRRRLEAVTADRLDMTPIVELMGQAEIALGQHKKALARGRSIVSLGEKNGCENIVAHGERLTGQALAAVDPERARVHLETALGAFMRAGIPYRAAQTRLALAQLLATLDPDLAGAEARMALTVFEDLGAGRDADVAAALLRKLGVSATRTGPKNFGRLTKREQEVLGLLGEGLSNPEIAERLVLSRKTVEHHVARILSKLGLRGRAQAAALVARNAS